MTVSIASVPILAAAAPLNGLETSFGITIAEADRIKTS